MAYCQHHWIIACPAGRWSDGTCQKCGAIKQFDNSGPDADDWKVERTPEQKIKNKEILDARKKYINEEKHLVP